MIRRHDSLFLFVVTKAIVPLIQVFAFYVITHGHYSPGGGFQGGVMLAASVIIHRITFGEESLRRYPREGAIATAGFGALCFALLGFAGVLGGGNFLEYAAIGSFMTPEDLRYWGIFLAEVFIGFLVWGALVAIFDALVTGGDADPDEPATIGRAVRDA